MLRLFSCRQREEQEKENDIQECSMKIPTFTPEQRICCTSVEDGVQTLRIETRLDVVRKALRYEQDHMGRKSMIKAIKVKIRKLGG